MSQQRGTYLVLFKTSILVLLICIGSYGILLIVQPAHIKGNISTTNTWENIKRDSGYQVLIGDINADGYDDTVAGPTNFLGPYCITYGNGSALPNAKTCLNGLNLTGSGVKGHYPNHQIGDFNNDGIDDLVFFAPLFFNYQPIPELRYIKRGVVYILFGQRGVSDYGEIDFQQPPTDIKTLTMLGERTLDMFGAAALIHDLNEDGIDDILILSGYAPKKLDSEDGKKGERIYIFYGGEHFDGQQELDLRQGTIGQHRITRIFSDDELEGWSTVDIADMDGDNEKDLIITSRFEEHGDEEMGVIFILYGKDSYAPGKNVDLANDGRVTKIFYAGKQQLSRGSFSLKDRNGDGFIDIVFDGIVGDPVVYGGHELRATSEVVIEGEYKGVVAQRLREEEEAEAALKAQEEEAQRMQREAEKQAEDARRLAQKKKTAESSLSAVRQISTTDSAFEYVSGVFVSDDGHLLTYSDAVQKGETIRACVLPSNSGCLFNEAEVVAVNERLSLALLLPTGDIDVPQTARFRLSDPQDDEALFYLACRSAMTCGQYTLGTDVNGDVLFSTTNDTFHASFPGEKSSLGGMLVDQYGAMVGIATQFEANRENRYVDAYLNTRVGSMHTARYAKAQAVKIWLEELGISSTGQATDNAHDEYHLNPPTSSVVTQIPRKRYAPEGHSIINITAEADETTTDEANKQTDSPPTENESHSMQGLLNRLINPNVKPVNPTSKKPQKTHEERITERYSLIKEGLRKKYARLMWQDGVTNEERRTLYEKYLRKAAAFDLVIKIKLERLERAQAYRNR